MLTVLSAIADGVFKHTKSGHFVPVDFRTTARFYTLVTESANAVT